MKSILVVFILIPLLLIAEEEESKIDYLFGPRTGFTYIYTTQEEFNNKIQSIYENEDKVYTPLITQFGLNLEQRILLGDTLSHFAFQEVILIGGLDQSIIIPSLSFLIGYRHNNGLEIGLGPNFSITTKSNGDLSSSVSVVYSIGWTFSFKNVYVPINLAFVPTPIDGHPRITLLTGFNFYID